MKKFILFGLSVAFALTSHSELIDNVKSIECVDSDNNKNVKMYFTTTHSGAEKYKRRPGSIPFSYGNMLAYTMQTGTMQVISVQGQSFSLFDDNGYTRSLLVLNATNKPGLYAGLLSGKIENVNGNWVSIKNHRLACQIPF